MSNENRNVPELRFPGFEDEWIKMKLDNLGNIFTGSTPDTSKSELYEGKYPFVSPIDIHNNRYVKSTNKTVSKEGFYGGRVIPKGASLFVCIGSTIGKVGQAEINVTTNQQINALIPYENYDDNFIYTNLYKSSNKIKKLAATQAVPIINKKTFSNFSIYIPKFKEQQKIGDFFSKLDQQIELEEKKLELLKQQKKGYMQQIFLQKLRFKDENEDDYPEWKTNKIEDIATVTKGFTPSTKNNNYWNEENKNWLSIAGMDEKYLYYGNKGITDLASQKHNKVDENTLIMSFKLTLGKLGIVKEPIYTNEAICHFNWKNENVNTEYVYYYLNYINIDSFGSQAVKGITLNNDSINSIVIKLPSLSEQYKISELFKKYDDYIEKQSDKIELLKERKKGFLQEMFV